MSNKLQHYCNPCYIFDDNKIIIVESWANIVGFEGYYKASTYGKIKSLSRLIIRSNGKNSGTSNFISNEKILKHGISKTLYHSVSLMRDGIKYQNLVSRLIATTFLINPHNYPEVNHKKGIKSDNRASQLEWCNHSQNQKHAFDTGLHPGFINSKGELAPNSKLTAIQVDEIRLSVGVSQVKLAKKYNIDRTQIGRILNKKSWI